MATFQKHWTKHLQWAGKAVKYLGDDQETLKMRIERLKNELENLNKEYDANEQHIRQFVSTDWTEEEIKEAMLKAVSEVVIVEYKNGDVITDFRDLL